MNLRKFLCGVALAMVVALYLNNSAIAVSKFSKAKNTIVSKVEEAQSGEKKTTEEMKAATSEKANKEVSGEEAKTAKEETTVSGEKEAVKEEKATDEKEVAKVSGEKEEAKVDDKKEEAKADDKKEEAKVDDKKEEVKEDKKEEKKEEKKSDDKKNTKKVIKDVAEKAWYFDYVLDAVDEELMEVQEEDKFNPEETVTKQEVADALYKISQRDEKVETKKESKATKEVNTLEWAVKKSVMREADQAEDTLTREEVARYVYSYARNVEGHKKLTTRQKQDNEVKFEDKNKISPLASEAVLWCNMNKIIIGRPDNTVGPNDNATRAEAATIFVRMNDFFAK